MPTTIVPAVQEIAGSIPSPAYEDITITSFYSEDGLTADVVEAADTAERDANGHSLLDELDAYGQSINDLDEGDVAGFVDILGAICDRLYDEVHEPPKVITNEKVRNLRIRTLAGTANIMVAALQDEATVPRWVDIMVNAQAVLRSEPRIDLSFSHKGIKIVLVFDHGPNEAEFFTTTTWTHAGIARPAVFARLDGTEFDPDEDVPELELDEPVDIGLNGDAYVAQAILEVCTRDQARLLALNRIAHAAHDGADYDAALTVILAVWAVEHGYGTHHGGFDTLSEAWEWATENIPPETSTTGDVDIEDGKITVTVAVEGYTKAIVSATEEELHAFGDSPEGNEVAEQVMAKAFALLLSDALGGTGLDAELEILQG